MDFIEDSSDKEINTKFVDQEHGNSVKTHISITSKKSETPIDRTIVLSDVVKGGLYKSPDLCTPEHAKMLELKDDKLVKRGDKFPSYNDFKQYLNDNAKHWFYYYRFYDRSRTNKATIFVYSCIYRRYNNTYTPKGLRRSVRRVDTECPCRIKIRRLLDEQEITVEAVCNHHDHRLCKEDFLQLQHGRRLPLYLKEEIMDLLVMDVDWRIIKKYVSNEVNLDMSKAFFYKEKVNTVKTKRTVLYERSVELNEKIRDITVEVSETPCERIIKTPRKKLKKKDKTPAKIKTNTSNNTEDNLKSKPDSPSSSNSNTNKETRPPYILCKSTPNKNDFMMVNKPATCVLQKYAKPDSNELTVQYTNDNNVIFNVPRKTGCSCNGITKILRGSTSTTKPSPTEPIPKSNEIRTCGKLIPIKRYSESSLVTVEDIKRSKLVPSSLNSNEDKLETSNSSDKHVEIIIPETNDKKSLQRFVVGDIGYTVQYFNKHNELVNVPNSDLNGQKNIKCSIEKKVLEDCLINNNSGNQTTGVSKDRSLIINFVDVDKFEGPTVNIENNNCNSEHYSLTDSSNEVKDNSGFKKPFIKKPKIKRKDNPQFILNINENNEYCITTSYADDHDITEENANNENVVYATKECVDCGIKENEVVNVDYSSEENVHNESDDNSAEESVNNHNDEYSNIVVENNVNNETGDWVIEENVYSTEEITYNEDIDYDIAHVAYNENVDYSAEDDSVAECLGEENKSILWVADDDDNNTVHVEVNENNKYLYYDDENIDYETEDGNENSICITGSGESTDFIIEEYEKIETCNNDIECASEKYDNIDCFTENTEIDECETTDCGTEDNEDSKYLIDNDVYDNSDYLKEEYENVEYLSDDYGDAPCITIYNEHVYS